MKYEHLLSIRELEAMGAFKVTKRKISAAKRALQMANDKEPLFSKPIPYESAADRVLRYSEQNRVWIQQKRSQTAQKWLKLRKILRSVPIPVKDSFFEKWNIPHWHVPHKPEYGLDLLRKLLCKHYGFDV